MKRVQATTFVFFFINFCLVINLVLSGAILYNVSQNLPAAIAKENVFQFLLVNMSFVFLLLVSINTLFMKIHKKRLHDKHSVDGLTGVMSRQNFVNVLERLLPDDSRAVKPLSLLMIDVDNFKHINEKHGFQTGDHILTTLGQAIQSSLRAPDIICRWSGDKFLVALKGCAEKDACRIAAKILVRVRQQELGFDNKTIRVTGSIGVAQMKGADTVKKMISRAEAGLLSACKSGRNSCAVGYDWIPLKYYKKPAS